MNETTIIPQVLDFPLPLPSGIQAVLRLPFPLSRADYDYMMTILTAMGAGLANDSSLLPVAHEIAIKLSEQQPALN